MATDEQQSWIWLEVADVRYEGGGNEKRNCSVLLRADREQPKPHWWFVEPNAVKEDAYETYKAILNEMDKKRMVLARLSCSANVASPPAGTGRELRCDSFRFQSPDVGSR